MRPGKSLHREDGAEVTERIVTDIVILRHSKSWRRDNAATPDRGVDAVVHAAMR